MINRGKQLAQRIYRIRQLHQTSSYGYFKENIADIFEMQAGTLFSIREMNSNETLFRDQEKRVSPTLNAFVERLYDKQDEIIPAKVNQMYTLQECELISDILENRLLQVFYQAKVQNINWILLMLDMLNFSILCCAYNARVQTAFTAVAQKWLDSYSDSPQLLEVAPLILQSISRIFQSVSLNQAVSLDTLQFNIFSFSKILLQKVQKQPSSNKDNNMLDIQIEMLYNLKQLKNNSINSDKTVTSYSSLKQFQESFQSNSYYDFWLDFDNSDEISEQKQSEDNQQKQLQHEQQQQQQQQQENNSIEELYEWLQNDVFDCILLKNEINDAALLTKILQIYPRIKLDDIPSDNFVHLIDKHMLKNRDQVIQFVELASEKNLYDMKIDFKLSFYQGFYNSISSNYLQQQQQQQVQSAQKYLYESQKYSNEASQQTTKPLSVNDITDLFGIMSKSRVVDFDFLKQLELQICQSNAVQKLKHNQFLKILHFFGCYPLKMDILTQNQINYYVSKHFDKLSNQMKISVCMNLLKLENQPDAPLYVLVQRPLFCTLENMSLVTNFIIQFNTSPNKTLQEKIQFYFLTKTFFKDQIKINKHFEEQVNDLKEAFIKAGFGKISLFQKQILSDLISQDQKENPKCPKLKQFQSEVFLEDVFSLDYLINENIVVEVNGPTHYFMISMIPANYNQKYNDKYEEIDTVEENVNFNTYKLLENRNTIIKTKLLSNIYKYQVKHIPFITYNKYKFLNKHQELVYEIIFSSTSLKDLKKLL